MEPITILGLTIIEFTAILLVVTIIQGIALWKAARLKDDIWFWFLLLLHTMGILPIIYLVIKRNRKI